MDQNLHNHRWWIVFAMGGTLGLILLDETVVGLSLSSIQKSLNLSSFITHWIVNAYLLTLTCFVAVLGKLGDLIGLKRWFIFGAFLFGIGALGAGLAFNGPVILAMRALQGLGAAILFPLSIAIVTLVFPPEKRGLAIGSFGAVGTTFVPISALVGGILTTHISWRLIFWMTLPFLLVIVGIVCLFFEEKRKKVETTLKDFRGVLLLVTGLALLIIALMQSHLWGWRSPLILEMLFFALIVFALFFLMEAKNPNPLIDVRLFYRPSFLAAALTLFTGQYTKLSIVVFGALYLQEVLDLTAFEAGLALCPGMVFYPFVTVLAGLWTDKYGPKKPILLALALICGVLLWFSLAVNQHSYYLLLPAIVVWGLATPVVFVPSVTAIMGAVSEEKRGQAGGIALTAQILGGALAIAVLGVYVSNGQRFSKLFLTATTTAAVVWIIVWAIMNNNKKREDET